MLAALADEIPPGMLYEPKLDGFRCLAFRDGDEVLLESRNALPLARYFPEVVDAVRASLPPRSVVDGEVVVVDAGGRLDFEALQLRIHPAASRVALLRRELPASYCCFDLLALGDEPLLDRSFAERRRRLEAALAGARPPVYLTPITDSLATARRWFEELEGAGVDGIVAKSPDLRYLPDRRAMVKVKHRRTAECVVAGLRRDRAGRDVASLLLGLYDDEAAVLHHVGVAASFPATLRRRLAVELDPLRLGPGEPHPWVPAGSPARVPGEASRWSRGRDLAFEPLRPERVAEVAYDHMEGTRFRHVTRFLRWRPDRDPASCTFAQLARLTPADLRPLLGGAVG
jgi:ATP-dependent DNA ligase